MGSGMDSAERLLKLLGLLEGRIDWTAEELARRLEVTTRTIRRDIARLRDLGYPVEAVAGPGGGYRLGSGGKLPPLLLDDEEALAVAIGLRVTTGTAVGGLEDASLSAMAKLEHVLPPKLRTRLEDISEATVSAQAPPSARVDQAALAAAAATARAKERLRFDYVDREGRRTERHTEPLRLVHTGRRWYLVAFDLGRDDWRTFRLDRVSKPRPTGMRAKRRRAPDPVELVQRGIALESYALRASVVLEAPVERASRVVSAMIGTVEGIDEQRSRLVIGGDDTGWIIRYLLSLPFDFEVESPNEVREELAALGRALTEKYSHPGRSSLGVRDPSP